MTSSALTDHTLHFISKTEQEIRLYNKTMEIIILFINNNGVGENVNCNVANFNQESLFITKDV